MIQKRNISTFAIGLCLLAFMLLSASPAKATTTTDPSFKEAYDICVNGKLHITGKAKKAKEMCFLEFRTKYNDACMIRYGMEIYKAPINVLDPLGSGPKYDEMQITRDECEGMKERDGMSLHLNPISN